MQESHLHIISYRWGILHKDIHWYLLKHRAVILVPPDENLCDGADGLH